MRKLKVIIVFLPALALAAVPLLQAQEDCGNECRINTNVAIVINVPVNASAQAVRTGWGIAGGIGYNFDRRNALIGEFMWNRVYPSGGALTPFETALQSTDLRGNTDLYTLTGEYRYELRGHLLGAYLIGGGGWYFRNTWLSRKVPSGTGTVCSPTWRWWIQLYIRNRKSQPAPGYLQHQRIGRERRDRLHCKNRRAPYRVYTEARYHYAPTKDISTQFITVFIGIRY